MNYSEITSRKNKLISDMCKLYEKKERDKSGLFLIEGIKLLREAVLSGINIKKIFYTKKALDTYTEDISGLTLAEHFLVSDEVYSKLSDESSPQGIICCCLKKEKLTSPTETDYKDGSFLILENFDCILICSFYFVEENRTKWKSNPK